MSHPLVRTLVPPLLGAGLVFAYGPSTWRNVVVDWFDPPTLLSIGSSPAHAPRPGEILIGVISASGPHELLVKHGNRIDVLRYLHGTTPVFLSGTPVRVDVDAVHVLIRTANPATSTTLDLP